VGERPPNAAAAEGPVDDVDDGDEMDDEVSDE
jgi:hypothetical protein